MRAAYTTIIRLIFKPFPQSLLIRKPFFGALAFFFILSAFVILYRPLNVHQTASLNIYVTAIIYCAIISLSELGATLFISRTNCFSKRDNWNIGSELFSIVTILTLIGISSYFAGFIMESQGARWNFTTFFDSFYRSVLIGIIPVTLPTLMNIRYAFAPQNFRSYDIDRLEKSTGAKDMGVSEKLININSKAKKDHLSFYPFEFIYAESKGNYVIFHLVKEDGYSEVSIRNSITDIENQLNEFPNFMRIHRAFIVNLNKIISREGNSLGYRLTLKGCDYIIPVSRQNVSKFEELMS